MIFYRFEQKKKSERKSRPHISLSNSLASSKKLTFHQFVREIGDSLPIQANCVVSTRADKYWAVKRALRSSFNV